MHPQTPQTLQLQTSNHKAMLTREPTPKLIPVLSHDVLITEKSKNHRIAQNHVQSSKQVQNFCSVSFFGLIEKVF